MNHQTKSLIGILAFVIIIVPLIAQPYYGLGTDTYYLSRHVDTLSFVDSNVFTYYNTTGDLETFSPTETLPENDTWTIPLVATAQDLDLSSSLTVKIEATTLWNITAFDQDSTVHISAFDFKMTFNDDVGETVKIRIGWGTVDDDMFLSERYYTTSNSWSRVSISTAQYDTIDDIQDAAASKNFVLIITENDAKHLIDDCEVQVWFRFFSANTYTEFDQILLILGFGFIIIGLVMTNAIEISRPRRRHTYRYSRTARRWINRHRRIRRRYRR